MAKFSKPNRPGLCREKSPSVVRAAVQSTTAQPCPASAPPDLTLLISLLQQTLSALQAHQEASVTEKPGRMPRRATAGSAGQITDAAQARAMADEDADAGDSADDPAVNGERGSNYNAERSDSENAKRNAAPSHEIRCYSVPAFVAKEEHEFLAKYKVENVFDLLYEIYDEFFATIMLMRNFDESEKVTGFTLQLLGEHLARPLNTLNWTCSHFADFDLLDEATAG